MSLISRLEWMSCEGDQLATDALRYIHELAAKVEQLESQLQGGTDDVVHEQD